MKDGEETKDQLIDESKKAEEELEASTFLSSIINCVADPIFVKDDNSRFVLINDALSEILGIERENIIGKTLDESLPKDQMRHFLERDKMVLESGQEDECEEPLFGREGKVLTIVTKKTRYIDNKGNKFIVGVIRDITERKKAEESLTSSVAETKRFRDALEMVSSCIYMKDSQSRYIYANRPTLKLFNCSAEEVVGRSDACFFPPETVIQLRQIDLRVLDGEQTATEVDVPDTGEGRRVYWEIKTPLYEDAEHKVIIGILGISTDITERKKAEEEIRSLAKFPSENTNPVMRISKDGKIMYANTAGISLLEKQDMTVGSAVNSKAGKIIEDCLKSGEVTTLHYEVDGRVYCYTLSPIKEGGYVNVYCVDITERKKAEESLLKYQAQLRTLSSELLLVEERERKRIAVLLHDDVCQILGLVTMKLKSLGSSSPQPEVVESVSELCELVHRTIESTRTLMSELRPHILYDLGLEAAVESLVKDMVKWQDDIKSVFEDDRQSKPLNDDIRTLLYQSVNELLMNIIKHAKASKVKVSVRKEGNNVSITIEDDGIGFDVSAVLRKGGAPGHFGLFSTLERMKNMQGKCEVESETNKGTRLTLLAPLSEQ